MPSTTTTAALLILPLPLSTLIFANNVRVMLFATPLSLLLNRTLHLTPAAVNAFYATMFVPSAFEAVYALVSDRLPWRGERRRPYFVALALVQALSTLFLARANTRHSALVSAVVLSAANSATAAVANGCVADVARGTQSGVSGGAASALEALRWGGNLVARCLACWMTRVRC